MITTNNKQITNKTNKKTKVLKNRTFRVWILQACLPSSGFPLAPLSITVQNHDQCKLSRNLSINAWPIPPVLQTPNTLCIFLCISPFGLQTRNNAEFIFLDKSIRALFVRSHILIDEGGSSLFVFALTLDG